MYHSNPHGERKYDRRTYNILFLRRLTDGQTGNETEKDDGSNSSGQQHSRPQLIRYAEAGTWTGCGQGNGYNYLRQ